MPSVPSRILCIQCQNLPGFGWATNREVHTNTCLETREPRVRDWSAERNEELPRTQYFSAMDLHILAATAHQLETQTARAHWHPQTATTTRTSISEHQNDMDFEGAGSAGRAGGLERSSDSKFGGLGGGITKHTKHRAAEQRRRERINER